MTQLVDTLPRRPAGRRLPVSFGQEQTWFLQQLVPVSALHHVAARVRIRGPLDSGALRRSLAAVHERHAAPHAVFGFRGDALTLEIVDGQELALTERDLSLAPAARRAELLAEIEEEALRRPFDLERGPLARFHLVRLDARNHALLVVLHRLAADERSVEVIRRELLASYAAFAAGEEPDLPDLSFQYPEHAAQERELLAGADAGERLARWRETLAGLPDPVELPWSERRGTAPSMAGRSVDLPVPASAWDALRALAEQEGAGLAVAAQAGLAAFLHRFARRRDVVLGASATGRGRPGADDVVGPFAGVLPLRVRVAGDPTWRELLRQVRDVDAAARVQPEVPLRLLCEELRPQAHPNMAPLVQVAVSPLPREASRTVDGVAFTFAPAESDEALFDVELRLDETPGDVRAVLRCKADLFGAEAAGQLARRLASLLEQMAASPDLRFSNLSVVPDDERQLVVDEWNQTRTDFPRERTIHALFEECADRAPDAPALRWEGFQLTYGELDREANRVAHHLRRHGVGLETRVGLYYGYSAEWVIGALATLKAGGAYVPLDPAYPASRLAAMCEDSDVQVLLVQEGLDDRAELPAAHRIVLSAEAAAIGAEPDTRLPDLASPDALAYVMFTSGSTGRPKAIGVTHRNVVRTVRETNYVAFGPSDTVGQASNISFDASTLEVWGALLGGSRLVGLRKEDVLQPERLRELLVANDVDIFFIPAALMKQLVSEAPGIFGSLTYFLSGGEQADYHTLRRLLDHGAPKHLINPYGPTETTVFAVTYECNGMTEAERHVPIGYPIGNTTCYVLDQYLQPVPHGVTGELYVGGDGVARGYLSRPDLTADKFVPDPFAGEPGARLYSTGDLGRHRDDGMLEFLGREDRQVKMRGFRIEPAEVEACVLDSGLAREVSVQVERDRAGGEMLVAYVVPPGGDSVDVDALREHVRTRVPAYMLPSLFVPIAALPLNANGKLDVRALREALPTARPETATIEPRTGTEGRLDALWRDVLDLDRLSMDDDFFALGGTSRQAARLVTRAGRVFGERIPLGLLFEHPTVAAFAEAIDRLRSPAAPAVPAVPAAPVAVAPSPPPPAPPPMPVTPPAPIIAAPPPPRPAPPPPRAARPASADTEELLAAIWREVLEVDELGPNDNFFTIGGHSLNANRAVARAQAAFGRDIPLRLLFQNPTLSAFAAAVGSLEDEEPGFEDELRPLPAAPLRATAAHGQPSIEQLLEAVEELSDEEVRRLIGSGS
jgi:amino acid adenylation domain-containing protein